MGFKFLKQSVKDGWSEKFRNYLSEQRKKQTRSKAGQVSGPSYNIAQ